MAKITKEEREDIEADILLNILKKAHPIIGGKHTSCDNLVKGFPKHMRGKAKKVRDELIKNKIFESKPTSYGDKKECWINPKKLKEIIIKKPKVIEKSREDPYLHKRILKYLE